MNIVDIQVADTFKFMPSNKHEQFLLYYTSTVGKMSYFQVLNFLRYLLLRKNVHLLEVKKIKT